jgi:Spx/MgsR family transcriptional regulator
MSNAPVTVYGIPNCNSVKKALDWLRQQAIPFVFHDFKKAGVPETELDTWMTALGWELLVNRKGTTWRQLSPEVQASIHDPQSARSLMLSHSSVIKRPVIDWGNRSNTRFSVGYTPESWGTPISLP